MSKLAWPFWILIPSDVAGIWAIVSYAASDEPVTGAYVGYGLCLLQMPLMCYGLLLSRKSNNRHYERAYTAHVVFTLLIFVCSNVPWHQVLMKIAHSLAGS